MTLVTELPENIPVPTDMDAAKWASSFRRMAVALGYSDMPEDWLVGWFANAIMSGYDTARAAKET
jgi:hypothetical protein